MCAACIGERQRMVNESGTWRGPLHRAESVSLAAHGDDDAR
jgi:hypothetical protein